MSDATTPGLSVDALTVDGRPLVRLHPLVKDNTGYSLSALLAGSISAEHGSRPA